MKDLTWFFRGVQSAIFLYVSCGPCRDASDQRRRRKEAKRSRVEKEKLREEDPVGHHQPAPFEINPYWQEEIERGPGPPARRVKKTKAKPTISPLPDFNELVHSESTLGMVVSPQYGAKLEAKMEQYRDRLKNLDPAHIKESWHNRWQRRDEEYTSDDETDGGTGSHSHHGRRQKSSSRYYVTRVPPVNDLHPPIVCTPSPSLQERRWMKDRPPSAAFMAGKEGTRAAATSRAGSQASSTPRIRAHSSPRASPNLSRQVASRAVEERIRRGEVPEMEMTLSGRTPSQSNGSLHLAPDSVRVMDYADTSTPESSLDIQRSSGGGSRKRRRTRLSQSRGDASSVSGEDDITPTTTTTTLNSIAKPNTAQASTATKMGRTRSSQGRQSTVLASANGDVEAGSAPGSGHTSPRIKTTSPSMQDSHVGSENRSPSLSARSSPSLQTSPPASPISFQARALSTNITAAPVSPLLGPQKDDAVRVSNADEVRPVITIRNSSLDVLRDLVSPNSLLSASRGSKQQASGTSAKRTSLGPRGEHPDAENSEEDDGWLWTESGERRWRDQREARDVRNRWSIDF